jgi:hypothetical protein
MEAVATRVSIHKENHKLAKAICLINSDNCNDVDVDFNSGLHNYLNPTNYTSLLN